MDVTAERLNVAGSPFLPSYLTSVEAHRVLLIQVAWQQYSRVILTQSFLSTPPLQDVWDLARGMRVWVWASLPGHRAFPGLGDVGRVVSRLENARVQILVTAQGEQRTYLLLTLP